MQNDRRGKVAYYQEKDLLMMIFKQTSDMIENSFKGSKTLKE